MYQIKEYVNIEYLHSDHLFLIDMQDKQQLITDFVYYYNS